MNFSKIGRKLIPSFLQRKRDDEDISSIENDFLYEFEIQTSYISLEDIKNAILLNPYSLLIKPMIKIGGKQGNDSFKVSFFVLNNEAGKKIQDSILMALDQNKIEN